MLKISGAGVVLPANKKLAVGDEAPDFVLPDQFNHATHLADLLGKGPVVLFFYPKDYSAGCTAEVCGFRDNIETFNDAGATVVGISADSTESHEGFVQRHRLPFILLSDLDGAVHKQYGVEKSLGFFRARVTFVIDRQGIVRHIFSSQLNIDRHIRDALRVIQSLQGES
jgi:peroxiredoxin Q/BCP